MTKNLHSTVSVKLDEELFMNIKLFPDFDNYLFKFSEALQNNPHSVSSWVWNTVEPEIMDGLETRSFNVFHEVCSLIIQID
jgi:hypothetical protein